MGLQHSPGLSSSFPGSRSFPDHDPKWSSPKTDGEVEEVAWGSLLGPEHLEDAHHGKPDMHVQLPELLELVAEKHLAGGVLELELESPILPVLGVVTAGVEVTSPCGTLGQVNEAC